jgi:hypothetical protein
MTIECTLTIEYSNKNIAETILHSIRVDDVSFVKSTLKQKTQLHVNITAQTLSSLLHSLDDYLACLTVAEKVANKN